jgi:4-hydroxybenzoate polyprenyltransferase
VLAQVLLVLAFGLTMLLPWRFAVVLAFYWLSTSAYTFFLKRLVLIDVVTLACLYTLRVLGGGVAINVSPSFWILAFSVFMFFSLALAKRYAELYAWNASNPKKANGRGYNTNDLQLVQLMGVAAGYISVLVMLLYINSPEIISRYRHVRVLWGVCPLLILWVSRVWLKASRGEMTDDPIVFAARDRVSRYVVALAVALVLTALL